MGRKLTSPNPKHPHTLLKNHAQKTKVTVRALNTVQLNSLIYAVLEKIRSNGLMPTGFQGDDLSLRHRMIDFVIEYEKLVFKAYWKEVYKWDFDESYDPVKLAAHMERQRKEILARESTSQPPESTPV